MPRPLCSFRLIREFGRRPEALHAVLHVIPVSKCFIPSRAGIIPFCRDAGSLKSDAFVRRHFSTRKISGLRNKACPPRDIGYACFAFELSCSRVGYRTIKYGKTHALEQNPCHSRGWAYCPGRVPTGPEIGEAVPAFSMADQTGTMQTLKSVMGPKGVLLVFYRSADW